MATKRDQMAASTPTPPGEAAVVWEGAVRQFVGDSLAITTTMRIVRVGGRLIVEAFDTDALGAPSWRRSQQVDQREAALLAYVRELERRLGR